MMGAEVTIEALAGKLNRVGYQAFMQAFRQAKSEGQTCIDLAHLVLHLLQQERTDLMLAVDHYNLDRAKLLDGAVRAANAFTRNASVIPVVSEQIADALDRGWYYSTLLFGEMQIRTGYLLVAILKTPMLRRAFFNLSEEFSRIPPDDLAMRYPTITAASVETWLGPYDGSQVHIRLVKPPAVADSTSTNS